MKVVCLCGSPKGKVSVTMQYLKYIILKYPEHDFEIFHVARYVGRYEKDKDLFEELILKIKGCSLVIWVFPLYILHVHGNYKRFIELIFERGKGEAFRDKYSASISTSINFYDNTAHNYIKAISDDLEMKYLDFFSAHMNLLRSKEGQEKLESFGHLLFKSIDSGATPARHYEKISYLAKKYRPSRVKEKISTDKRIVVVADRPEGNVVPMIERFKDCFSNGVEIYFLEDVDIKGGCRGCLKCGPDNICFYEGKDGYKDFYNDNIKSADILIFAGRIKDRYLSSEWKTFFDRRFFYTHRKTLNGKQVGFLISGPFKKLSDLR